MRDFFAVAIIVLVVCLVSKEVCAESLCVAPASSETPQRCAPGLCGSGKLSFQIDDRAIVQWPEKDCIEVANLDANIRHKVTVYRGGKAQQSFRFHFADYKSKKPCLFLNDLYWTVQLQESKDAPWCKCK
jgi:hypothetical protein